MSKVIADISMSLAVRPALGVSRPRRGCPDDPAGQRRLDAITEGDRSTTSC